MRMSTAVIHSTGNPVRTRIRFAVALAAALVGSPAFAAVASAARTIEITKFAFVPGDVTIAPGTRIVWTNRDEVPHTITSKDKRLASKGLDTSDSFEYTFVDEGDYNYYCSVHPFMIGVVHVRKQ
jgi:plastocyanin